MESNGTGYFGTQQRTSGTSDFNALDFFVRTLLEGVNTATLCRVEAVTNDGGVSPVGFVDLTPLVNLVDGAGNATPRGRVYRCPYLRLQGGANAVILDPQAGDIGIAVFADRDISSATANKAPANPGSARRFDMADALYLGGVLNGTPTQFVQFSADGIKLVSPTAVVLEAPSVEINCETFALAATSSATITTPTLTINGNTQANGTVTATGTITAPTVVGTTNVTFGGKSGVAHTHSGVQTGSGNSGPPT